MVSAANVFDLEAVESLPEGGETFLQRLTEELDFERVESILLFGSSVTGDVATVSDLDIIVVVEDEAYRDTAKQVCRGLMVGEEVRRKKVLERMIERLTGMFQSGFVTTEREIREGRFHRIVNVSRLSYVLSPHRIVLSRVFDQTVPIYGQDIRPDWGRIKTPAEARGRELCKSMFNSLLLSLLAVLYYPFSDRATAYSLEAYKWTIYNAGYLVERSTLDMQKSLQRIPDLFGLQQEFRELREELDREVGFVLLVPLFVVALHVWSAAQLWRDD